MLLRMARGSCSNQSFTAVTNILQLEGTIKPYWSKQAQSPHVNSIDIYRVLVPVQAHAQAHKHTLHSPTEESGLENSGSGLELTDFVYFTTCPSCWGLGKNQVL